MYQDNFFIPPGDNGDSINVNIHQRTEELYRIQDQIPDNDGLITAPVIFLDDPIVFPRMISPIYIKEEESLKAIFSAQSDNRTVIALIESVDENDDQNGQSYLPIGVELAVGRLIELQDGKYTALVQSRRRVEIKELVVADKINYAKATEVIEKYRPSQRVEALMRSVRDLFKSCVEMDGSLPEESYTYSLNISDPGWLSDMITTILSLPKEQRQELLVNTDPISRLKRLNSLLADELSVLELEDEIQAQVQTEVDRSQREFYLREQLRVIQNELGEGDIWTRELIELNEKLEKTTLPDAVRTQANREIERLKQMPPMAPEVGIIRTYVDWILDLPWSLTTEDNLDVNHAKQVLEANHYALDKAKDRILEYIAVRSLKPKKNRQPILCFVGPPGTGKTSLGRSIADALGRNFVRLSLGGVRDEAEIRGHRRTYIGAMPGRILQTMRRAGSINPLFMLDEVDKLGADFRGDPSAALLEVLDPEQNNDFSDHYLEVSYDLSKVLFITTANTLMTIPPALMDRMEIIEFSGYIEEEKLEIANRFLIPRQLEENGLDEEAIRFENAALKKIIREYTYEAGVRNFEREIGSILRKIARAKSEDKPFPRIIKAASVSKYLGPVQFFTTEAEGTDEIGVATAIAWTENGGEIMPVEVLILDGKGNLQLTGQIGEVMQESAQAALSYLKSKAKLLNLEDDYFEGVDIHIHIPEGAIPKDGPSAGITMATALTSAITQIPVHHEIGMTGEITLRGRILPVGGIREKVLAAARAGIKKVLLPSKNEKDLIDVPAAIRRNMQIFFVNHMDDVLSQALQYSPVSQKERGKSPNSKQDVANN